MRPIFALGLLICVGAGGCRSKTPAGESAASESGAAGDEKKDAGPVAVEASKATLAPMETTVSAQGILTVSSGASARVAFATTGRVRQVLVREGERVETGQLLATIDNRGAAAAARSASAALKAAQAEARQAELGTRVGQNDQNNALRGTRLALQSALSERNGAFNQARIALGAAQSDLRRAQIAARSTDAANAVHQATLTLNAARAERDGAVKASRNFLESAQTDLQKLQAGARPAEIAQLETGVEQARATRERAATEVERVQFLFDKGIKARRELDDAKTALRVAGAALESAQAQLVLLKAGARIEDIRAAQLRVEGAREALDAAGQSGASKVLLAQSALQLARAQAGQTTKQRPEDLRGATLKVSAARDALAQAQRDGDAKVLLARSNLQAAASGGLQVAAKAEDARSKSALAQSKSADLSAAQVAAADELRAPINGIVAKRMLNAGDIADPAQPVLEINDTKALILQANLPAESGAKVLSGQVARISAESAPGRVFVGRVQSVGQIDPQSGLMTVRVAVFNAGNALKIGALAACEVVVARRPLAVVVPRQAVITREGKPSIFVISGGKAHLRTVVTGVESGAKIEIRRGVRAGEAVIRLGQYELEDDAEVETNKETTTKKPDTD